MVYKVTVHSVLDPDESEQDIALLTLENGPSAQYPFMTAAQAYAIADAAATIMSTEALPLTVTIMQTNVDTEVERPS